MAIAARLAITLLLSAVAGVSATAEQLGRVVGVRDGDSIEVLLDGQAVKLRLEGIDCPELGQDFGLVAKRTTSDLVFGATVRVKPTGQDRYGRTLAVVYLLDGISLNEELVRRGMAWRYRKYSSDPTLAALEEEARRNNVGVFAQASPMAPWDFRASERRVRYPGAAPTVLQIRPLLDLPQAPLTFHGNKRSHVFHAPTCEFFNCKNCTVLFADRDGALGAGFRPAACCRP
jgi:micrococcal nuclease